MIDGIEPYPMMRESGVPWIGEVPAHWEVRRLGSLGAFSASGIDKKTVDGEPLVRMVNYLDIFRNPTHTVANDREYMVVSCPDWRRHVHDLRAGDMVFTPSSETIADIGCSAVVVHDIEDGVYSYHVIRFRPSNPMALGFQRYWCNSAGVLAQFSAACKGTTRQILTRGDFRSISVVVPPINEQEKIGGFLDHADRRIRRYIRAKQKLIKLLEEQKQAIIHRAVTRGLDPNVRLKPSGVEWLGDVPEHWEVVPFKRRVGFQEGPGIMAADFRDEGIPLLRISCLQGQIATLTGCNWLDPEMVRRRWSHFAVRSGDYLLSASASTGSVVLATDVVAGAIPYTGILRLWPISGRAFMPYVRLYMGCRPFQDQIHAAKSGVAIEHFGPTHLKRMSIVLPPVKEQGDIVQFIESEVTPFESAADRAAGEIDLLREYRTRLIADVVTGKLDVREAAARLPEQVEEAEPLDEPEVESDEEATADGIEAEFGGAEA